MNRYIARPHVGEKARLCKRGIRCCGSKFGCIRCGAKTRIRRYSRRVAKVTTKHLIEEMIIEFMAEMAEFDHYWDE